MRSGRSHPASNRGPVQAGFQRIVGDTVVDSNVEGVEQAVSTGTLPGWDQVDSLVAASYERNRACKAGSVADYIPVLAQADPDLFGVCVVEVDGGVHVAGDAEVEFSIQSISKAFVYALVCEDLGHCG